MALYSRMIGFWGSGHKQISLYSCAKSPTKTRYHRFSTVNNKMQHAILDHSHYLAVYKTRQGTNVQQCSTYKPNVSPELCQSMDHPKPPTAAVRICCRSCSGSELTSVAVSACEHHHGPIKERISGWNALRLALSMHSSVALVASRVYSPQTQREESRDATHRTRQTHRNRQTVSSMIATSP